MIQADGGFTELMDYSDKGTYDAITHFNDIEQIENIVIKDAVKEII
jgi:hypothetical protein